MILRPLVDSDWPALEALERAEGGGALLSDRRLFERAYRSPWSDGFSGMVAEETPGVIDALALFITVPGRLGGARLPLSWPAVLLASERGRAGGVGGQLALWYYRNLDLVPSMNGTEQGNRLKDMLARKVPGLLQHRFVFIHDADAAANFCPPETRKAVVAHRFTPGDDARWRWSDRLPEGCDELWRRASASFGLTVERDFAYLSWRYSDFPYMRYRFLLMDDPEALAVVRFQDTPAGRVARIVDFVGGPGTCARAWSAVAAANAAAGAAWSDFYVVGTAYHADLREAGFAECDEHPHLWGLPNLLSPIDHRHWIPSFHLGGRLAGLDSNWTDPARVYFTKGDCDRDFPTRRTLAESAEKEPA